MKRLHLASQQLPIISPPLHIALHVPSAKSLLFSPLVYDVLLLIFPSPSYASPIPQTMENITRDIKAK